MKLKSTLLSALLSLSLAGPAFAGVIIHEDVQSKFQDEKGNRITLNFTRDGIIITGKDGSQRTAPDGKYVAPDGQAFEIKGGLAQKGFSWGASQQTQAGANKTGK